MRLLTFLLVVVLTVAVSGCTQGQPSYKDREAAPGDADPSAAGAALGGGGAQEAAGEEGGEDEASEKEASDQ
jgi:hypothetical protein